MDEENKEKGKEKGKDKEWVKKKWKLVILI